MAGFPPIDYQQLAQTLLANIAAAGGVLLVLTLAVARLLPLLLHTTVVTTWTSNASSRQ